MAFKNSTFNAAEHILEQALKIRLPLSTLLSKEYFEFLEVLPVRSAC